jgi:WD40 repeat protein
MSRFMLILSIVLASAWPSACVAQAQRQPDSPANKLKPLTVTPLWAKDASTAVKVGRSTTMYALAFTPGGKALVGGFHGAAIIAWDATTGRETGRLNHKPDNVLFTAVWAIAFSADGKRMISGSDAKSARIWAVQGGKEIAARTGLGFAPYSVALSGDGSIAAARAGSFIRGVVVWETETGKALFTSEAKEHSGGGVGLSPDGKTLAFIDEKEDLHLVDVPSGKDRKIVSVRDASWKLHMSPDGKLVATGREGALRFYSADDGKELGKVDDMEIGVPWCLAGNDRVAAWCRGVVRLYAVPSGDVLGSFRPEGEGVTRIAASDDGKLFAIVGRKIVVVKVE